MINGVTMKINVDQYLWNTLREDITSEDVSTNAVMPEDKQGKAELICKQDGIICGLDIFKRTFELLDETSRFEAYFKFSYFSARQHKPCPVAYFYFCTVFISQSFIHFIFLSAGVVTPFSVIQLPVASLPDIKRHGRKRS